MKPGFLPGIAAILIALLAVGALSMKGHSQTAPARYKVTHTVAEWHKLLTPDQYDVLRNSGTEPPFQNAYWNNEKPGEYYCAACGQPLFSSKAKFDSGTGWPSFRQPLAKGAVIKRKDDSLGEERTEVICSRCGSHLGHVFDDGPKPTGLRYCMNSAALKFVPGK